MKLSTSIIVVLITLGASFAIYSTYEAEIPEALEANILESLPAEEPDAIEASLPAEPTVEVEVTSTQGLDTELTSILEGYAQIQEDFDRLESQKTATGAGN